MRPQKLTLAAAVLLMSAVCTDSHAVGATASDWYADCEVYIGVLTGTGDGDDLDLTYCIGQTLGIVAGLETGARIGALSMASLITVLLNLDGQRVFQVFEEASDEELLGYCAPDELSGSRTVTVVADFLGRHPDKGSLPVTAVFFEALQEAYPCRMAETTGSEGADTSENSNN